MGGDSRIFPPTLDGTNNAIWKSRVEADTMGKKYAIYNVILNGFKSDFDDFTELEKRLMLGQETYFLQLQIVRPTIKSLVAGQRGRYGIILP